MAGLHKNLSVWRAIVVVITPVLLSGCFGSEQTKETGERIYARVNDEAMTESDLKAIVPREFYNSISSTYRREIIREWVNTELLYQEALRLELDKEPHISRILENSRRELLSNEILERKLAEIPTPSDEDLRRYYKEHSDYFVLPSDEFEIRYALFDNMDDAKDFYNKVKRGASFSELAATESKDPSSSLGGSLGIVNVESVEPAIWDSVVSTYERLGLTKISSPFKCIDGFGIVIVDAVYERGSTKPFEVVRDQVQDYFMLEKREEMKETYLKTLMSGSRVEYQFN